MKTYTHNDAHLHELEMVLIPAAVADAGEIRQFLADRKTDWHLRMDEARFGYERLNMGAGFAHLTPAMIRTMLVASYAADACDTCYVEVSTDEEVEQCGDQFVGGDIETGYTVTGLEDTAGTYHSETIQRIIGEFAEMQVSDNAGGLYR